MPTHPRLSLGITLIETMITSLLLIMVIAAAMVFWQFFQSNTSFAFSQSQSIEKASSVVERLARDLRQATIAADGSFPLTTAGDTELVFHADTTGDGVAERIRYRLVGTEIERGVIVATGTPATYTAANETTTRVASNVVVTEPIFAYYNGDWPEDTIANPLLPGARLTDTRMVTITLHIQQTDDSAPVRVSRTVMLRGL